MQKIGFDPIHIIQDRKKKKKKIATCQNKGITIYTTQHSVCTTVEI